MLLFGAIIPLGTLGEPPLEASTQEAAEFFRKAAEAEWVQPLQAVGAVGMIGLMWFLVGFVVLLRRAEGDPPWRSTVALASAVLLPAYYLANASWASAAHRGLELDPTVAAYAFDIGNIGFANTWVALGSFAGAAGWVMLSSGAWPRWLGWWGGVAGVGMGASPLRVDDRTRMVRAVRRVLGLAADRGRTPRDWSGRPGCRWTGEPVGPIMRRGVHQPRSSEGSPCRTCDSVRISCRSRPGSPTAEVSGAGSRWVSEADFYRVTADRCERFDELVVGLGRDPRAIRHSLVCFPPLTPWESPGLLHRMVG